jgi:hypothetical protein
MTCNLKAEVFSNALLCNADGNCKTPGCPYVYPGTHPSAGNYVAVAVYNAKGDLDAPAEGKWSESNRRHQT